MKISKKTARILKSLLRIFLITLIVVLLIELDLLPVQDGETIANMPTNPTSNNVEKLPSIPNGELKVYVFDVGQADCILISSNDHHMMIDAGNNPDGKLIAAQLEEMGITRIDYLVGTHPHEDHIGGLDKVIDAVDVGVIYMPSKEYNSATYRDVLEAADAKNIDIIAPEIGYIFFVGDAKCEIMAIDNETDDANLMSIIIEVTYGENKFLFTGDAEIENEERRLWNDVDVLKVGHHGSSTSTSEDFMEQIKPEIALISVGTDNSYGHPHNETMELLESYDLDIYRTDIQGTILVTCDGITCTVETFETIDLEGNTSSR